MSVEIRYVKRLLLGLDFSTQTTLQVPLLPEGYYWKPWNPGQERTHARLVYEAFKDDIDGRVFPTFRQFDACEHLIDATTSARSFVPEATWSIFHSTGENTPLTETPFQYCAAIQCVRKKKSIGEIQNVSVQPSARRLGLGRALVLKALCSFQELGARRVTLEATAENFAAIRLYASLGFQVLRVFYTESFIDTTSCSTESKKRRYMSKY